MAKKISQLPTGATLTGTELLEIVQSGTSKSITASQIAALATIASSGITLWDLSSNAFLPGSIPGQMYYGTGITTSLTDASGNLLPTKVLAIALIANASTNAHYMFVSLIF